MPNLTSTLTIALVDDDPSQQLEIHERLSTARDAVQERDMTGCRAR